MLALRSLARAPIFTTSMRKGFQHVQVANQTTKFQMKVVPLAEARLEGHEERNMRLKREMSPHLTIYKPQLTSMLSITHRGTGLFVSFYAWGLGLFALLGSHDVHHYLSMIEGLHLGSASLGLLKFCLAFPMMFHTWNGFRHLMWDTGRFLTMKEVYSTGYATVAASIVSSIAVACL